MLILKWRASALACAGKFSPVGNVLAVATTVEHWSLSLSG